MSGEVMSVKEVAEALDCSGQWVTELIRRGEFPARRFGKSWAIDRVAFKRYLAKRDKTIEPKDKPA